MYQSSQKLTIWNVIKILMEEFYERGEDSSNFTNAQTRYKPNQHRIQTQKLNPIT